MAHTKAMTLVRIDTDLMKEIRSMLPDHKSDIKRIDYLLRIGMKHV